MTHDISTEAESTDTPETFSEQYFRKLVGRVQKTVPKVRRIDLVELMELAWVDGMLEPFAERLIRSRPELKDDIEIVCKDLRSAD